MEIIVDHLNLRGVLMLKKSHLMAKVSRNKIICVSKEFKNVNRNRDCAFCQFHPIEASEGRGGYTGGLSAFTFLCVKIYKILRSSILYCHCILSVSTSNTVEIYCVATDMSLHTLLM